MRTVLIVGPSFHTLTNYLTDNGYEYIVLKDVKSAKDSHRKLKRRVICDFSSDEAIYTAIEEIKKRSTIDAIMTIYENYIVSMAKIAKKLSLPAISIESAMACTDKKIMRELFAKATTKISPDFAEIKSEREAIIFAKNHSFPLILKPTNLAKSLLVSKINSEEELRKTYQKTISQAEGIYQKYGGHKTPKFIIEEFMEGSIHSVDAFIDSKGTPHVLENVVDYQTGHDIGHNDNFHYSRRLPSRLTPEQINSIRETADLGCRALGMKNSPAHIEIILTADGPRIVEIGARNGGYRERMHKLANGISITNAALSLAFGKIPNIRPKRNESCAVLELFPKQPGQFAYINKLDKLKNLKSLNYLSIKTNYGEFVGSSSDGYKACAIIILHNRNPKQFNQDLDYINQNVFIITHPA